MKKNNLNKLNHSTRWMIKKELEFMKKAVLKNDYGYASYKATFLTGMITTLMYEKTINDYTYFLLSGVISSIEGDGKINISRVKEYTKLA